MRFPFPPAEAMEPSSASEVASEPTLPETAALEMTAAAQSDAVSITAVEPPELVADLVPVADLEPEAAQVSSSAEPESDPSPPPPPVPRPRSRRKVIAFPRQVSDPPAVLHRLADPVVPDQPRILDVPEELEAFPGTPLLDGLQFSAHPQSVPTPSADHIELPFQAVRIGQRLFAGVIDCALVAVAAGIFGAVVYKMQPQQALTKPLLLTAAGVPVLLWAIYQYLLGVYSGTTVGMRVAKIRLSTFKGSVPTWSHRRSRVIGLYFSAASLLMGLLWALVDVDVLCWHDRISRTYLTNREQQ
jgi:uncharacterized RDD family membrane protein YckC